jgi:hypothetical protein
MAADSSRLEDAERRGRDDVPSGRIAGLIDGSMTMLLEPGGGASFRVLVGAGGDQPADRDLLELVVSAEHVKELGQALADRGAGTIAHFATVPPVPCHIGFRRQAINAAA